MLFFGFFNKDNIVSLTFFENWRQSWNYKKIWTVAMDNWITSYIESLVQWLTLDHYGSRLVKMSMAIIDLSVISKKDKFSSNVHNVFVLPTSVRSHLESIASFRPSKTRKSKILIFTNENIYSNLDWKIDHYNTYPKED